MVDEGRIGEREEAFSGDRLFPADLQWGTEVVDTWNEKRFHGEGEGVGSLGVVVRVATGGH